MQPDTELAVGYRGGAVVPLPLNFFANYTQKGLSLVYILVTVLHIFVVYRLPLAS